MYSNRIIYFHDIKFIGANPVFFLLVELLFIKGVNLNP